MARRSEVMEPRHASTECLRTSDYNSGSGAALRPRVFIYMALDLSSVQYSFPAGASAASLGPGDDGRLSWRQEPDISFSDIQIEVSLSAGADDVEAVENSAATATQIYHCHRSKLSVGPRRCDYMTRLFSGGGAHLNRGTADGKVAKLEFQRSACEAFPIFLDFVYAESAEELAATPSSAVALMHLGEFLGCPAAFNAARDFIQGNMNIDAAARYIR